MSFLPLNRRHRLFIVTGIVLRIFVRLLRFTSPRASRLSTSYSSLLLLLLLLSWALTAATTTNKGPSMDVFWTRLHWTRTTSGVGNGRRQTRSSCTAARTRWRGTVHVRLHGPSVPLRCAGTRVGRVVRVLIQRRRRTTRLRRRRREKARSGLVVVEITCLVIRATHVPPVRRWRWRGRSCCVHLLRVVRLICGWIAEFLKERKLAPDPSASNPSSYLWMLPIRVVRGRRRRRWICTVELVDGWPRVRSRGLRNITECLRSVKIVGRPWIASLEPVVLGEAHRGRRLVNRMRLTRSAGLRSQG